MMLCPLGSPHSGRPCEQVGTTAFYPEDITVLALPRNGLVNNPKDKRSVLHPGADMVVLSELSKKFKKTMVHLNYRWSYNGIIEKVMNLTGFSAG